MNSFYEKMVDIAIDYDIVLPEERNIYLYAFQTFGATLATWGTFLLLGCVCKCFWGVLCYAVVFIPLRIYSGGIHANTYLKCYFASFTVFLLLIAFYTVNKSIYIPDYHMFAMMLSCLVIFMLSPIEDPNKPLDAKEVLSYRKKSRKLVCIYGLLVLVLYFLLSNTEIVFFMSMAINIEAILLLVAKIQCCIKS